MADKLFRGPIQLAALVAGCGLIFGSEPLFFLGFVAFLVLAAYGLGWGDR